MASKPDDRLWCSIAEQASKETDPAKLTILVEQLCRALDERLEPSPASSSSEVPASSPVRPRPAA